MRRLTFEKGLLYRASALVDLEYVSQRRAAVRDIVKHYGFDVVLMDLHNPFSVILLHMKDAIL